MNKNDDSIKERIIANCSMASYVINLSTRVFQSLRSIVIISQYVNNMNAIGATKQNAVYGVISIWQDFIQRLVNGYMGINNKCVVLLKASLWTLGHNYRHDFIQRLRSLGSH